MTLDVEIDLRMHDPEIDCDALARLVSAAARYELGTSNDRHTIGVCLTSDSDIADFHARYFGDASPTDVITFPADDDNSYLGDIVISIETAAVHAQTYGNSTTREVAFLALHGLLHLCGYRDTTPEEREAMLLRQEELLIAGESWIELRG